MKKYSDKLKYDLARLDWIKILDKAIKSRPTSWRKNPVIEWVNASDEVMLALIHELEDEGYLENWHDKLDRLIDKHSKRKKNYEK